MRTALALGWQGAFLLHSCCDVYNDKAMRAARGAAFKLPHAIGSWADLRRIVDAHELTCLAAQLPHAGSHLCMPNSLLENDRSRHSKAVLKPFRCGFSFRAGSAAEPGSASGRLPSDGGVCLVLGSEGQGLSPAAMEACRPVSVPMDGDMESLNVAVAGGILMFALSKARDSLLVSEGDA